MIIRYETKVVKAAFEAAKVNVEVLGNKKGIDWLATQPEPKPAHASKKYKANSETFEARKAEALKLIPALDEGKIIVSYIEKYVGECGYSLQAGQRAKYFKGTKYEVAEGNGRTPTEEKVSVNKNELEEALKAKVELEGLRAGAEVGGKVLVDYKARVVSEQDYLVIEALKKRDPAQYNTLSLDTKTRIMESLKEEIARRIEEEVKREAEARMGGFALLNIAPSEDDPQPVNPAGLESPVFTPEPQPEKKPKKEKETDFLDRVKALLLEGKDMENEDYQRLLALKGKNNVLAAELVDMFETSPENAQNALGEVQA